MDAIDKIIMDNFRIFHNLFFFNLAYTDQLRVRAEPDSRRRGLGCGGESPDKALNILLRRSIIRIPPLRSFKRYLMGVRESLDSHKFFRIA
jgi:hypothetical protein